MSTLPPAISDLPVLKLLNVESAYGPIKAIRGVSLQVRRSEIATVLGSNGAGKTTILKTISGIIDPRKGSIEFKGQDITIYGDGLQTRSFCYVDDLIEGMIRLMDSPDDVTGPINVGNPGEFTMIQLAETVLKLVGSKSKLVRQPLPADDPKQRKPDITRAQSVLGWEPKVQLEDGLKETIAYFRKLLNE